MGAPSAEPGGGRASGAAQRRRLLGGDWREFKELMARLRHSSVRAVLLVTLACGTYVARGGLADTGHARASAIRGLS